MTTVSIYVPTYRHVDLFEHVLSSYLRQTHEDIMVHIFDNSCADGYYEIKNLVRSINDKRVEFVENTSQLGALGNYNKIFSNIRTTNLSMVLPSDKGLAENAIEKMLEAQKVSGASIVKSASRNYDISDLENLSSFSLHTSPHQKTLYIKDDELVSAYSLLFDFFGPKNIRGEFYGFSAFGALFDGELAQGLSSKWRRFKYHGCEHFISMNLLLRGKNVRLMKEELVWGFIGHPRLGGTERLEGDIGRIECLMATQEILDSFDFWMIGEGIDINKLRRAQIAKAEYFLKNFSGFEAYAHEVVSKNLKFLN